MAAIEAAEHELNRHTNVVIATKTSRNDIVTAADRALEATIRTKIATLRPDDSHLGEENGVLGPAGSDTRWIIDPIDGTVNFAYGIPSYAVSIAVEVRGIVELGVVADLVRHERFVAVRNQGATLDGRSIAPTQTDTLIDALIGVGMSYDPSIRLTQADILAQLAGSVRDFRQSGVASLDLCWTACGRLDGYFETGLKPWDYMAGALILQEAGGQSIIDDPGLNGNSLTLGAGPNLFPTLLSAINLAIEGQKPERYRH